MKTYTFILLGMLAFITAGAFRYATDHGKAAEHQLEAVTFKKHFTIRCSALWLPGEGSPIPALTGWGNYHWKVSTNSDSAQFYFDQGINMYYAFHIIEARASFDKAAGFDPGCAMAWWGKALSFGPNINDFGYARPSEAYPSAMQAMKLKNNATPLERSLIDAMSTRYTNDSASEQAKLNVAYKEAMNKTYMQFGKSADVATLYADALMLLHPWDLYDHAMKPKAWTPQLVNVIQQALRLAPKHPGANHYYIHAVEASAHPELAMKSAEFLATAMPDVAHITHMPSHIYIRTGYYNKGIGLNDQALAGFDKYLAYFPATAENLPLYSLHNLHMKMACAHMAGNYAISMNAAKVLQSAIPEFYLSIGGALGNYAQYLHASPLLTDLRFGKWDNILQVTVNDSLAFTSVMQHFARGIAYARTNKLAEADMELQQLINGMKQPVLHEVFEPFNSGYGVALIMQPLLEGTIAMQRTDMGKAISFLEKAVVAEDALIYNEPRDWLLPARQVLGDALLQAGRLNEAIAVYNKDLEINPNNGWSLTGLAEAYKRGNQPAKAAMAARKMGTSWMASDTRISRSVF